MELKQALGFDGEVLALKAAGKAARLQDRQKQRLERQRLERQKQRLKRRQQEQEDQLWAGVLARQAVQRLEDRQLRDKQLADKRLADALEWALGPVSKRPRPGWMQPGAAAGSSPPTAAGAA